MSTWQPDDRYLSLLRLRPACVSPVLVEFGRELNDVLNDGKRQQLTPLIPALIGTAGDGQDVTRSFLALDWLIRVYTPAFLRLVPDLVDDADRLAGLEPIMDEPAARAAGLMVQAARTRTDAAWYAAWKAAWKAAGDAAWEHQQPTVDALQDSAITLFTRMTNPGVS